MFSKLLTGLSLMLCLSTAARAGDLVIAKDKQTSASIVVSPNAGIWEKQAATDLQKYIEMMSGAKLPISETATGNGPQLFVGQAALQAQPNLQAALNKIEKPNPTLRADAIVVRREGNRVLLAGTNDDAHYYAVIHLLNLWGCRWYLPNEIGECIPDKSTLTLGEINFAYAPPFEVRNYRFAWNGSTLGKEDFQMRNMMNDLAVPNGHHPGLADWTKDLVPEGKRVFDVPIADEKTMDHVANQVEPMFAKDEDISLGMEDGVYNISSVRDKELQAGLYDKYMLAPVLTDSFMTLYNGVAKRLLQKYPNSKSRIGFLAYTNITIPPQQVLHAEKPLVAYLAPIDIDPIHSMDDPKSAPRQEYKNIMQRWAQVMDGRVVIYDYDQSMLVWRDLPNPAMPTFATDVKHYRDAKILGVSTETRGALATTFTNLFWRGQLMWNPDADAMTMRAEFAQKFYGPAAAPMQTYWDTIEKAWSDSLATEHEYMVAPAVYTPAVVAKLKSSLEAGEKLIAPLAQKNDLTRNEKLFVQRMAFTRASFDVLENYMAMVGAAASEADYKKAYAFGEKALGARLRLANLHPTYTTRVVAPAPEEEAGGAAWFPGEVAQYRELQKLTDGSKGKLVAKLPLEWAFRRDPHDSGLASGWAYAPLDLSYWNAHKTQLTPENRKDYPTTQWEIVRSDVYLQAQGIRHPDGQSYTGFGWYRTSVDLNAQQVTEKTHVMFPGLFNECWLYVNGVLVAHREFPAMWWNSDYKFEWDVDVSGKLKSGANEMTLRISNPHHFGGMFRRPFLYSPAQ
jgi:hypothetical protein